MENTFRTISANSQYLLKEKQSKFFGYAFPVSEIEEVKISIEQLKKRTIQQDIFVMHIKLVYQV